MTIMNNMILRRKLKKLEEEKNSDKWGGELIRQMNGGWVESMFSQYPKLSTSEDVKAKLEESKRKEHDDVPRSEEVRKELEEQNKPLGIHKYLGIILDYLFVAIEVGGTDAEKAKDRFKKIFFDPLHQNCPSLFVTFLAMAFEGWYDLFHSDLKPIFQFFLDLQQKYIREEDIREVFQKKEMFLPKVRQIYAYAMSDIPLIIVGETGTGKELACNVIHTLSPRRLEPLIGINCSAIPENLLESELFGHEEGAFTDATNQHIGMFERCDKGTIFLDELGKMPPKLQGKLLRVIQEKKITRVGGEESMDTDVRFIAALQPRDLYSETINSPQFFLPDLKWRLGFPRCIELPTLNARLNEGNDIAHFIFEGVLGNILKKMSLDIDVALNEDTVKILLSHKYPGNHRELYNILETAVISMRSRIFGNKNEIIPEDLPINESHRTENPEPISIDEPPTKDLKLVDIISYANKKRKDIVEEYLCNILKKGKDIKSLFIAEGNPPKKYQNYLNTIRHIIGKSIQELKRSLKS